MLAPLSLALTVWTLAALALVPCLTACLHLARFVASLSEPVCDVAAELVAVVLAIVRRPAFVPSAESIVVPLCGVASVDRVLLLAFV